ncbi:exopolyphosphatase [Leptothrix ochracea]|uniref:Ppx/GppA phosphatase family protein n=1 Tax=Leptothrix ochracea TaxID=735331 RepID=UPI0034E298A6
MLATPSHTLDGRLYAALDLGSNSFRLEISRLRQGRYLRQDYLKESVRLGAGLSRHGRLNEDAMRRGLACLARFRDRLDAVPEAQVRVVATQTLREAVNRDSFVHRAELVLGHPIDLIGGREEARLIYLGVSRLQPAKRTRLVIDIGGRSTELILGRGAEATATESFGVGCISLAQRHFPDGRYTPEAFRAAQITAAACFGPGLGTFGASHWQEALGSSGTVASIADILYVNKITDGTVTPAGLRWCIEACLQAGRLDRLDLPGLEPGHRAVLASGLAILYTLAIHLDIQSLLPARGALRQGVVFDLDDRLNAQHILPGRPSPTDLRDLTVQTLQTRFQVDGRQARRVHAVALMLFDQAWPCAPREARQQLGWAAALHETGRLVSHHEPHRHGAYLVEHADAPGFSYNEQQRIAALIGAHQGPLPSEHGTPWDDTQIHQMLCLRLATLICHGRDQGLSQGTTLHVDRQQVRIHLPEGGTSLHLRTTHLLGEEIYLWQRAPHLRLMLSSRTSPGFLR